MNLIRFIQIWRSKMAKILANKAKKLERELPRIELIPSTEISASDILREKEILDLVAQIILLSKQKGRPLKQREEDANAA